MGDYRDISFARRVVDHAREGELSLALYLQQLNLNEMPQQDQYDTWSDILSLSDKTLPVDVICNFIKINAKNEKGFPLIYTYLDDPYCTPDRFRLLVEHGGEVNFSKNKMPLLIQALYLHRSHLAEIILRYAPKINVNVHDESGTSALMHAVIGGYEDVITLLIAKGASVKKRNKQSKTALDYAYLLPRSRHKESGQVSKRDRIISTLRQYV